MMHTNKRWIGVATLDWDAQGLLAQYPQDLPRDWLLTWYANVSMALVLSPKRWRDVDAPTVIGWCDQVQDNFWFYLYCDTQQDVMAAQEIAGYFPCCFAGLVCSEQVGSVASHQPMLRLGNEVCWYDASNIRSGKSLLTAWLAQFSGDHGLVLVAPNVAQEIKQVQTLLGLLGEIDV